MNSRTCVELRRSCTVGLVFSFIAVISALSGSAQTPTLLWEPSPDPSVAGYRVFWGTTPGSYSHWHDVGSALTFVIPNAIGGQRYFIAISAYNALGVVGPPSYEVSALFATAATPIAPTSPPGPSAPIDAASTEDHAPPQVVITIPTTQRQHHTLDSAVVLGGTASDDTSISSIQWQNSRGGGGRATGTDAWIATIPLYSGSNAVSITAIDRAGNSANKKITIYRRSE